MADETTQAASSTAEVEDAFKGEQPSMAEYSKFRQDGELPERFKPAEKAESGPADDPEETDTTEGEDPEPEPDSDPEDAQEPKPKSKYEKRVLQLLAEKKELERKLAEKQDVKTESSPAKQPLATADKEPTAEDANEDGTPKFATYEEFTKALARHEARKERAEWQQEQAKQEFAKAFNAKLDEARGRYENFDKVKDAAVQAVVNDAEISPVIKAMLDDSDVLPDLIFTLGSDPAELAAFAKLAKENPGQAIRKLAIMESLIVKELGTKTAEEEPPARQTTKAPKPPAPVGGASMRTFDVSDESLSAEEWARKRTKQLSNR